MDFGEAFDIFIGIRNGDIEAANAQFMSLKDNDPNQFIRSLVQIICDSTSSDKRKINAIKFLSVPLQRSANNTSEYRLAVFDLDLIKDILALLFSFFEYADEISVPSIECFIIYASSFKTGFLLTQIKYLFQSINNEIAVTFFEKLLYTIYKCLKWICLGQDVNIPQYFQIMNEYLENHEVTPKSRKYYVKIVKTLLLLWPPSDSQNQILSDTFSICWNYTLQFPQDGDKLWKMILPFNYFLDAIPNLPDLVYQSIMNSFDMWSLLSVGTSKICYHNHWDYILSEHEIDVINFVVNLLTQEVEEFDPKLIQTSVDAIVFAVRDNGPPREIIIQYISSHIEEVETKEKFASIILLYSIVSCSNAEEFGDNFSEIIKSVLQESSELSIFYSIEMIGFAINKNLFVVDEEMIQIIGQFLNSESTKIVDAVLHTLSYLGGNQDSDIRQAVLSLLMGIVTNYENVETVSSCLRSLEIMQ
ncbi:hypothetical protein TVAG_025940 [Trichomonas vaginalis G3]|uniref:Uncharacterized protein n=1 Tax=Trichomonas vaginalis (strain ATCC PRA-98 / G3) TaxID=412133 RepID=A2G1Z1_TRIV3|nr:hypothetical protein TVAG_025940 [Trichomonas vaginalis G3]|eukprot:XP_001301756.1 hypothetical protein [Trichomonas vaginalis G3]